MSKQNEFYCIGCNEKHKKSDFYVSYNSIHSNGVTPYCKKFIKKEVTNKDKSIDLDKFKNLLMQMDAPFLADYWQKSVEDKKDTIGVYYKNLSLKQNRGLKWKDSVIKENEEIPKISEDNLNTNTISKETKKRWGKGYESHQLEQLERFYIKMKDANKIETPQDEFYLEKLALISLKMNEELEKGNYTQAKQLGDLFSKYMADSQFRAVDKTDADRSGGIRNFGTIYAEVEKDGHIPPWEYYRKIKGLSQDILDKTIMHIENFTLRFNKAETMSTPPKDTPKADVRELDLDNDDIGDYDGKL